MAFTPDQVQSVTQAVVDGLTTLENIASGIDPALQPFLLIGKAIEAQIPGLAAHITAWIEGNPPTQAEIDQFNAKLAVLGSTDGL